MKIAALLLCLTCFSILSYSQINPPNITAPSANVSLSKQGIQISNDMYNGKVNVALPILSYEMNGLGFPISLSYNGGNGIKPDELPSWVGLGWNLQLGGYIHRTVRGKADEVKDIHQEETVVTSTNRNASIRTLKTTLHTQDYSYFNNLNKLNNTNWYTQAFANALRSDPVRSTYPYPITIYNTGSSAVKTYANDFPLTDVAPDEFTFVAPGISGKFYKNHLNKCVVLSEDNKAYSVEMNIGEEIVSNYKGATNNDIIYKIPRTIRSITLTSNDGIKYFFGNIDPNAPYKEQVYEYSRTSGKPYPENPNPDINSSYTTLIPATDLNFLDMVSHTWHLTRIENLRNNTFITIDYTSPGYQFYDSYQAWGNSIGVVYKDENFYDPQNNPFPSLVSLSALSRVATRIWLPTTIKFSNGIKIKLNASLSQQLFTNTPLSLRTAGAVFNDYLEVQGISAPNNLYKLDGIEVYNTEDVLTKNILFRYSNLPTERLKLSSVTEKGSNGEELIKQYQFDYNPTPLPGYGSGKTDHWGFYNNKNFFETNRKRYYQYDHALMSTYNSYREPDYNYADAEILTKIIYPSGGAMEFEYEPNQYAKTRNKLSLSIENKGTDISGGGVRLKSLINREFDGTIARKTSYSYKDPVTGLTSGTMGFMIPSYLIETPGSSLPWIFMAGGYNPINYRGAPITYSQVTEREEGNGSTTYSYSNFDNGFNDQLPVQHNTDEITSFEYAYRNNAFKRGKLIGKTVKNESGDILTQSTYKYQHDLPDVSRNQDELRSVYFKEQGTNNFVYAAISDILYNDYIAESEDKYFSAGETTTGKTKIRYDNDGNIKERSTETSDGKVNVEQMSYASDFAPVTAEDAISKGIKNLVNKNCKGSLVETINIVQNANGTDAKVTGATLYTYDVNHLYVHKVFKLNLAEPVALSSFKKASVVAGQLVVDNGYDLTAPDVINTRYDTYGNVLEQQLSSGVKQVTLWGYKGQYPVASITGSDYTRVNAVVTQIQIDAIPANNPAALRTLLNQLRTDARTKQAVITTATYAPLVGITSETDAKGYTMFYHYDAFGRLSTVRDNNNKILKQQAYNYSNAYDAGAIFYNQARSGSFVKNDCLDGHTSFTSYIYTVPEGKHSSKISRGDAEEKAQNDIKINGQAYANSNGSCYKDCSVSTIASFRPLTFNLSTIDNINFNIPSFKLQGSEGGSGLPSFKNWTNIGSINGICRPSIERIYRVVGVSTLYDCHFDFKFKTNGEIDIKLVSGDFYATRGISFQKFSIVF